MDAPAFQKISLGALEYKRCNSPMEPPCRFFASVSAAENKPFYFLHAVYEGIIAGGAAGVIAEAVLYPIDTIKTRLQAVHGGGKINLKGLYSGLAGNLAGVLPASAIFVGVYEPTKQKLLKSLPENLSALAQLTAGAIGGAASSLVRVPTEVVKQRMQTGQFASAPDAIRLIVSEEGFKGLYAGYGSFLLRDLPFDAIQFCIYEQMLMGYKLAAKRDPKDAEIAIVGAFAGAITGAMTTPLDVVKTRLMVQGSANQYKGIFDCARTIAKEEGTRALLKVAADHMRLPCSTICCRVLDQEYYGSVLEVQSSLVSLKRQSKYSLKGAQILRCEQDLTLLISRLKHFNTSMSEFFVH